MCGLHLKIGVVVDTDEKSISLTLDNIHGGSSNTIYKYTDIVSFTYIMVNFVDMLQMNNAKYNDERMGESLMNQLRQISLSDTTKFNTPYNLTNLNESVTKSYISTMIYNTIEPEHLSRFNSIHTNFRDVPSLIPNGDLGYSERRYVNSKHEYVWANPFIMAYQGCPVNERDSYVNLICELSENQRRILALLSITIFKLVKTDDSSILYYCINFIYELIPLDNKCDPQNIILKLTKYPTTDLSKSLTTGAIVALFENRGFISELIKVDDISDKVKLITSKLIKYINCNESILTLDRELGNQISNSITKDVIELSDMHDIHNAISTKIDDGELMYVRFRDNVTQYGKFNRIRGSLHNQLRSSMYNHRLNNKLTLDEQLEVLFRDTADDGRPIPKSFDHFPDLLKNTLIKNKSEMIILGKQLKHCIGSHSNSDNWFFRKDTVCAEVNSTTLRITQCYDKSDKITEKSTAFKKDLSVAVNKLGVTLRKLNPTEQPKFPSQLREHIDTLDFDTLFDARDDDTDDIDGIDQYQFTMHIGHFTLNLIVDGVDINGKTVNLMYPLYAKKSETQSCKLYQDEHNINEDNILDTMFNKVV